MTLFKPKYEVGDLVKLWQYTRKGRGRYHRQIAARAAKSGDVGIVIDVLLVGNPPFGVKYEVAWSRTGENLSVSEGELNQRWSDKHKKRIEG